MRGKAKDGKGSIVIILYHNASTTSIGTGIRVTAEQWDRKLQKVVNTPGAEAINVNLQKQKASVDKAIAVLSLDEEAFYRLSASELKAEVVSGKPKLSSKHLVSDLFEDYLRTGKLKDGTVEIYRTALKKVIQFSGYRFCIENVNLAWLRAFDKELSKTQSANGRSIYLRAFRAVCNYARNNDIDFSYPFKNFHIESEPTQKRSVPVELMREFMRYPTSKTNAEMRDYFFLMFFLIGINIKDLLLAHKTQVIEGRLEYVREKTRKKYSIKIEPEAQELISRYSGKGVYLLEAMERVQHYKSFMKKINEALNDIGPIELVNKTSYGDLFQSQVAIEQRIPLIEGITTYYARHSWATYAYEIGIPMDIISQAMGHSFGNRTTLIYVKPDQDKVDEANRRVIDYLLRG